MSLKEKTKDTEALNVEGILADFFLKKMESQESISGDDSSERRRKKHKKHKSRKSKNKHRSRSCSSEEKKYLKSTENHSSSEEKEIRKLQRLKKLDIKENKFNISLLSGSQLQTNVRSDNHDAETISSLSIQTDIPYGPSLETLLSGAKVATPLNTVKIETKNVSTNDCEIAVTSMNSCEIAVTSTHDSIEGSKQLCEEDKGLTTDDSKNSLYNATISNVSKEKCSSGEKEFANKDNSGSKKSCLVNENKVVAKRSHSKSESSSEDEKRSSRSERRHSRSRSRSNHKSRHRKKNSHSKYVSRSRSHSRSRRSRSKDSRKKYSHSERKGYRSRSRRHRRTRSRSNSSDRYASRRRHSRHRSRSHSYERSRHSPSRRKSDSSPEYSSKSSRHSRSKSSEREKYTSKNLVIDKAKIRQLAQKNVLNMIEKGTLPEGLSLDNFKKEQIASLKTGGKSVQELTDFCMKLSKKENDPQEDKDKTGNDINKDLAFIHHPFKLKETSTIKLNIKNAIQIPVRTHAEKFVETARLSSQFPVSSGNQHKQKELEWIPVEASTKGSKIASETKAVVPVSQSISALPAQSSDKLIETVPSTVESEHIPSVVPSTMPSTIPLPPPPPDILTAPPLPPVPPLPPPPPPKSLLAFNSGAQPSNATLALEFPMNSSYNYSSPQHCGYSATTITSNYLLPSPSPACLPQPPSTGYSVQARTNFKSKRPIDVASIVTQRFKALTKLQGNPNDPEALQALEEAQTSIQDWVESQQVPGLFTGTTGAKLLSVQELSGPKHWMYRAKKDTFTRAAPVTEGKGMSLLKKMGWNPGEGLGKNKEGSLEPLLLDIKMDKKGLVSEGEGSKKMVSSVLKDLQGKHPVSALMELCSKRKWKPPLYTLLKESGPPHKKLFLFKVEVNNVEYQSATPINNKKVAKADAAVICLQTLSIFPKS